MSDSLSMVKFNVVNFFSLIMSSRPFSPITTTLIKVVDSLINSEPEPDKEILKRLNWIYQNTHKKVMISLPVIELAVYRNLDKGLNKELDIFNKTFALTNLYKYLDEISLELCRITSATAKRYSLDVPMIQSFGKSNTINI